MNTLAFISWDVNPNIIESPLMIRYYGLLWAISFFLGFYMVKRMLKNEGFGEEMADKFLIYTLIGGVLGARLGHVFFYDWSYYKNHLGEIFQIWNGGLASHGGAIGIIISTWLLSKKVTKKKVVWALDKIVVVTAIAGALIRFGNLMNSEIIGAKSESSSAFFFEYEAKNSLASFFDVESSKVNIAETDQELAYEAFNYPVANATVTLPPASVDQIGGTYDFFLERAKNYINSPDEHYFAIEGVPAVMSNGAEVNVTFPIGIIPRIPTQIWEAVVYLLIFFFLFWGYWKQKWYEKEGFLFGAFLVLVFLARFIIEFWKEHQTASLAESTLNMGQILSIPAVLAGLVFIVLSLKKVKND